MTLCVDGDLVTLGDPLRGFQELRIMSSEVSSRQRSPTFLRLSAGFIYFFFGFLKFFPDLSPGELIAGDTIMRLSIHSLDAATALWWLALVECLIGLSFLFNAFLHWTFFLFLLHQAGTFLPLFVLPELTFKIAPFAPTLEGQYILKNVISVAAAWTVMLPTVQQKWRETFQRFHNRWHNLPSRGSSGSELLQPGADAVKRCFRFELEKQEDASMFKRPKGSSSAIAPRLSANEVSHESPWK